MWFNIISLISFIISLFLGKILSQVKNGKIIVRGFSVVLFIYKVTYFIIEYFSGNFSVPVEISTLSYFLVPIILTFGIRKLYYIASFFGISAGLGFFFFYIFAGFTLTNSLSFIEVITGCLSHGYLLIAGIYLYNKNKFENSNKLGIWVTILGMLCWALLFYDIERRGITFIYYVIKPTYLFLTSSFGLNILILILFYLLVVTAFYFYIKLFYKFNKNSVSTIS